MKNAIETIQQDKGWGLMKSSRIVAWLVLSYIIDLLTLRTLKYLIQIFSHLRLCLATAIHNFKWLKSYVICEI